MVIRWLKFAGCDSTEFVTCGLIHRHFFFFRFAIVDCKSHDFHILVNWRLPALIEKLGVLNCWRYKGLNSRSSHEKCSIKKVFLKISPNSQENTCARVSYLIKLQASTCNFIKNEIRAQVFSCEFFQIFKNTYFTEHLWTTASETLY